MYLVSEKLFSSNNSFVFQRVFAAKQQISGFALVDHVSFALKDLSLISIFSTDTFFSFSI